MRSPLSQRFFEGAGPDMIVPVPADRRFAALRLDTSLVLATCKEDRRDLCDVSCLL